MSDPFFNASETEQQKKKKDFFAYVAVIATLAAGLIVWHAVPEIGHSLGLSILFLAFAVYGIIGIFRARIHFGKACVQGKSAVAASLAVTLITLFFSLAFFMRMFYRAG